MGIWGQEQMRGRMSRLAALNKAEDEALVFVRGEDGQDVNRAPNCQDPGRLSRARWDPE